MYCIDLYNGIQVIYNNFHCYNDPKTDVDKDSTKFIEINHCLRGKFECLYDQEYYAYLTEGDLSISRWSLETSKQFFTFGYYEGIEVLIDVEKAKNNEIFSEFNIDIDLISKKIEKVADDFEPFNIKISGCGAFPNNNHIKVIWIGVESDELLVQLHDKLDEEFSAIGFDKDKKFSTHLTIGRMKSAKGKNQVRDTWQES